MRYSLLLIASGELGIFSFDLLFNQAHFLLNAQLAFLASMLIIYTSFLGYKAYVSKNIENANSAHQRDALDKIEDPFELYDEEEDIEETLDIKELKKSQKKEGFKKMVKALPGHISKGRVLAYLFLVFSFIALVNNDKLNIAGFLMGITIGLITAGLIGSRRLSH